MRGFRRRLPSEAEYSVVASIMQSSADPRAAVFLNQFARGPVSRLRSGSALEVTLDHTTADLVVDLEDEVRSDPIRVHNLADGELLEFYVRLAPGGFFGGLWGSAVGPWPSRWAIGAEELAVAAQGVLRFGSDEPGDPQALADLLNTALHGIRKLRHGASTDSLIEVEAREARPLPNGVRDFLHLADGLEVGTTSVLGGRDLHTVEVVPDRVMWLVGVDADGTHYVCDDDGVLAFDDGLADPGGGRSVAPSYLDWVRQLIA